MKKTGILLLSLLLWPIYSWAASSTSSLSSSKGYTETRYPIVLVHGLFGFDNIAGVDYFYGIPRALSRSGAKVYVAQVSATNSNEARGEQLLRQVKRILAITGASKVNLIGHSQGAPTTRYVASVAPQFVASVTTVGGVNFGSEFADAVRKSLRPGSGGEAAVSGVTKAFASFVSAISGNPSLPQDPVKALNSLTTAGLKKFNRRYPEGLPANRCGQGQLVANNGVYYFSWSGTANRTNFLDISDIAMSVTGKFFSEANDGLVGRCATHLGRVIRDNYRMNHLDEVNQVLGIHHAFETDPVTLYRQHANRLQQYGL